MTTGGWIMMIASWIGILGMFAYCMTRSIRGPKQDS